MFLSNTLTRVAEGSVGLGHSLIRQVVSKIYNIQRPLAQRFRDFDALHFPENRRASRARDSKSAVFLRLSNRASVFKFQLVCWLVIPPCPEWMVLGTPVHSLHSGRFKISEQTATFKNVKPCTIPIWLFTTP